MSTVASSPPIPSFWACKAVVSDHPCTRLVLHSPQKRLSRTLTQAGTWGQQQPKPVNPLPTPPPGADTGSQPHTTHPDSHSHLRQENGQQGPQQRKICYSCLAPELKRKKGDPRPSRQGDAGLSWGKPGTRCPSVRCPCCADGLLTGLPLVTVASAGGGRCWEY